MNYQSVNPYDGTLLQSFEGMDVAELDAACATAGSCFEAWRQATYADRATIVARAADILRVRIDDFTRPITLEMGKLIDQSRGEVILSANILTYYAENAERFLAPKQLDPETGEADVESSPIDVLLGSSRGTFPTTNWHASPPRT